MNTSTGRERDLTARAYRMRQTRQMIANAVALFFVLLLAAVYKRPDIFGIYTKGTIFAVQALVIAAFIGFTAVNWRCPSCRSFLGSDFYRRRCNKCGIQLQ